MNKSNLRLSLIALALITNSATLKAQTEAEQALALVVELCPNHSEEVSLAPFEPTGTVVTWGGGNDSAVNDENAFRAAYAVAHSTATPTEVNSVATNAYAVQAVCNSYRLLFLQKMLAQNVTDAQQSIDSASDVAEAINFAGGFWKTGDVRASGRKDATAGWLFLNGQTIGNTGSGADHAGPQYEDLFELAKLDWGVTEWDAQENPVNNSAKDWSAGDTITLPDLRGRAIYAPESMGGVTSDVPDANVPSSLGEKFGNNKEEITTNHLPSHTHNIQPVDDHDHIADGAGAHNHGGNTGNGGVHSHGMQLAGDHDHDLRTSVFTGSSGAQSNYPYFEGKARPNYQNTIRNSVTTEGDHSHTINSSTSHPHSISTQLAHNHHIQDNGGHGHTAASTGDGQLFELNSPGVVFNYEVKL